MSRLFSDDGENFMVSIIANGVVNIVVLFYNQKFCSKETALFGSRSGPFRLKKDRFFHRKAALHFLWFCKHLKNNGLQKICNPF